MTDICSIDVQDLLLDENMITLSGQPGESKSIYVPESVVRYIEHWMEDRSKILGSDPEDALFISTQRKRISSNAIRDMLRKYTYNIEKNITPQNLRHTTGATLYEKSGDLYLVAEVLGHKNLQNTKRYATAVDKKKKVAAEMLGAILDES